MSSQGTVTVPRARMLATFRNRHGVVAAVEPFDGDAARRREDDRYRRRQGVGSALLEQSTLARLARDVEQLGVRARQGQLFDEDECLAEIEWSMEEKEEELRRRRQHCQCDRDTGARKQLSEVPGTGVEAAMRYGVEQVRVQGSVEPVA